MSKLIDFFAALFGKKKPRPQPIALRPIAVTVVGAPDGTTVELMGPQGEFSAKTVSQRAAFPEVPESLEVANLHIRNDGYKPWDAVVTLLPGGLDIIVGPWPLPITDHQILLTTPFELVLNRGLEYGRLHISGKVFFTEANEPWQWRGATQFLLFYKFLQGIDIQAILSEQIALGVNVVRVLGMVDWRDLNGQFHPQNYTDYCAKLSAFIDLCAARGIRVEFVVFADAQLIMPNEVERSLHFGQVVRTLLSKWNVFIEVCNEPFKNLPGGADEAYELGREFVGQGILIASGNYGGDWVNELPRVSLDYVTYHPDRGPEWPRKVKDAYEMQQALNLPVVTDEAIGADELDRPGSRSNTPSDFMYAAAVIALLTPGGTIHTESGIRSNLLGPIQMQCASQWMYTLMLIGAYAQQGDYTAGHLSTCPIEHSDDLALRTFGSIMGNKAIVVAVRPTDAWTPRPKNGWNIDHQFGAIIYLSR